MLGLTAQPARAIFVNELPNIYRDDAAVFFTQASKL